MRFTPPPMQLSDFDFDLPETAIALRPAEPRDSARMLRVVPGEPLTDLTVSDLPAQLRAGDVLVLNDTRVIPARLSGTRTRGASVIKVEATLHQRLAPNQWSAFMRPGKRLAPGDDLIFGGALSAMVLEKRDGGEVVLAFALGGVELDLAVAEVGVMPLPPYIAAKRAQDQRDRVDYQTVYAAADGSVAAPTAGLHFTPDLLGKLEALKVKIVFVRLHVGAGTFLPVKVDDIADHKMHSEYGEVTTEAANAINAAHAAGGRVVCVGTTSLRLIESAADESGIVQPFADATAIFITPGYKFRAADGLMTNFHLPKSTLFMLVSAFAGLATMREAYAYAIGTGYRFYSYGDSSLLWRA